MADVDPHRYLSSIVAAMVAAPRVAAIILAFRRIPNPQEIASVVCRRYERRPTDVSVLSYIFIWRGIVLSVHFDKPTTLTADGRRWF